MWDFVVSVALAVLIGALGGMGAAKMSNMMDSTTARTAFSWIVPFAVYVGLIVSLVLIAVRFCWMFGFYKVNKHKTRRDIAPLCMKEVVVLTWGGMRGLVSLALILSISGGALINAHEVSIVAMMVLLCTMVIPGMTLPWLLTKLDLAQGPDALDDQVREALIARGHRAALKELYRHANDLPPQFVASIEHWLTEEADARMDSSASLEAFRRAKAKKALVAEGKITLDEDGQPVDDRCERLIEERVEGPGDTQLRDAEVDVDVSELISERMAYASQMRVKATEIRKVALEAAQSTVLAARREPGQDPAIVDQVLRDIDRMLIAVTAQR